MARYKFILAYDGARFEGSQRQLKKRTVQGELEKALQKIGWTGRSAQLAGRTDSGVHAEGQAASADLEWGHSPSELVAALNANLPNDLAVREAHEAPADFQPRFDATSRLYRYRLFCDNVREPTRERFLWRVWPTVETLHATSLLNEAAQVFIGKHDFASFGSAPTRGGSTERTVITSAWTKQNGEWQFRVRADAFLYRMVRRLVYVQVAVAQNRLTVEKIRAALKEKVPLLAGLAPAHGLSLIEVNYSKKTEMQVE